MSAKISYKSTMPLHFERETVTARFNAPSGEAVEKQVEIRTNPITGRTSRIAFSRIAQWEAGTDVLPEPPPDAGETTGCPFCRPQVTSKTPQFSPELAPSGRFRQGDSLLFPNLYPYGSYSAVSLFDNTHFVEIGTASLSSYTNSFLNCDQYLRSVLAHDPEAIYMAITQNHLPSAGGSLLHPHLQVHADRIASNHHRFLQQRATRYFQETGSYLFFDYLHHEKKEGNRYIGDTGSWEWVAAFAPEGFFEIWGILPQVTSLRQVTASEWEALARGVLNIQRFYRSLHRNGYNFGLLLLEDGTSHLELRAIMLARANYAPWARNDRTSYEVMLGDMTTFIAPEKIAQYARPFWKSET